QPVFVEDELDPGGACRDLLGEIVDGGPQPAIDDDRIGTSPGHSKRREQFLAIIADGRPPAHREPEILELLGHIAEIGVDDLAGQNLVPGADDLDAHALPLCYYSKARLMRAQSSIARSSPGVMAITSWLQPASRSASMRCF